MSDTEDISEVWEEHGILLRLWSMILDNDNIQFRLKLFNALGGITSTEKKEPIDMLLQDGILDNLFRAWDTDDQEGLRKILWITSNISSSSPEAAATVYQSEFFEYAIYSLCKDEIDDLEVKKEAIYLLVNTFHKIDNGYRLSMIQEAVGEDWSQLLQALIKAITENYSLNITFYCLQCIYDILITAFNQSEEATKGQLFQEVLDEFNFVGGPETIEQYTGDTNNDISRIAGNIETEFLREVMDQVHDQVDFRNVNNDQLF